MIHKQPIQEVEYNKDIHAIDIRIRSQFQAYEATYVILNPFYSGGQPLTWENFKLLSDFFKDLNIISRNAGFYNFTLFEANLLEWEKFISILKENNIKPPVPEQLDKSIFYKILNSFKESGYTKLKKEFLGEVEVVDLHSFILSDETILADGKLFTPDEKFCLAQDFDQITTFFSGPKEEVEEIVLRNKIEGFFADSFLTLLWDRTEIEQGKVIERDKVNVEMD